MPANVRGVELIAHDRRRLVRTERRTIMYTTSKEEEVRDAVFRLSSDIFIVGAYIPGITSVIID